jgi:hypothetical protein
MTRPSAFRKADLTKAIRATVAAGVQVGRVEVAQDGKIVLVIGNMQTDEPKEPQREIVL